MNNKKIKTFTKNIHWRLFVWFKIDNQTFYLANFSNVFDEYYFDSVKFTKESLDIAFNKIQND